MLIAYFDEVKAGRGRPYYWLGAVIANAELIWNLERQVNDLSEEVFGTRALTRETEFHGSDIYNGNKHFKDWPWERKIDLLRKLTTILGTANGLAKVYVKIQIDLVKYDVDVEDTAFMFLVERVNMYLRDQRSPGLLIGDRENETVAGKFASKLSDFKERGTTWEFGLDIDHLLDTVHFTHSHHSRMLQLTDFHMYLRQFCAAGDHGKVTRKQLIDHVNSLPDCLSPKKYKVWPGS